MREMTHAGELEHLTPERVWKETKAPYHPQSPGAPCNARLRRTARFIPGN